MQVKTKTMGVVEVADEQIIDLPSGLLGFSDYHKFALIDCHVKPLIWMQSLEESELAFLLVDPFIVCEDYEADIDDDDLAKIDLDDPSRVLVMAIVTIPNDGSPVTANLRGPLIINKENHLCMQAILNDARWTTKHEIGSGKVAKTGEAS